MAPTLLAGVSLAILLLGGNAVALTPTPTPEPSPTTCHLLPGSASIVVLGIEPAQPVVGDAVVVRFNPTLLVYSHGSFRLEGSEELLDGSRDESRGPFQLRAIADGTAMLEIAVPYRTEYRCGDIYVPGPEMVARSSPFTFDIFPANPSPSPSPAASPCAGDCDGDGQVTIAELVAAVGMSLDNAAGEVCGAADVDADGRIAIAEIVSAVRASLFGCVAPSEPVAAR